jgi:ribonuclease VapC
MLLVLSLQRSVYSGVWAPRSAAVINPASKNSAETTRNPTMAAPTAAECLIVLTARHGAVARTIFERLRAEIGLRIADFTEGHAAATQRAYLQYGKGRHPAALNFGDCMSYAAAKLSYQPLLATGDDFPQTDLEFNGGVIGYWPTPSTENSQ